MPSRDGGKRRIFGVLDGKVKVKKRVNCGKNLEPTKRVYHFSTLKSNPKKSFQQYKWAKNGKNDGVSNIFNNQNVEN